MLFFYNCVHIMGYRQQRTKPVKGLCSDLPEKLGGQKAMQDKTLNTNQNIILENRKSLVISGITDVDSFDEREVCLYTSLGELTIQGKELHIDSMSVETGDMTITGDIWAVVYGDKDRRGPLSALGRLFR